MVERDGCDGLAVGTAVGVEFVRVNKDGEVLGASAVSDKVERRVFDGDGRQARGVDGGWG